MCSEWVDEWLWVWLMYCVLQAVSLYWMGAAAEKSGDMQAGRW